jgi:hydrophobe/amphiphile efflux-3 (HAE3) family protein
VLVVAAFTLVMLAGASKIYLQTDLTKENPQGLEVYRLASLVSKTFGGQDTVLIAVTLDQSADGNGSVRDIRDPRVIAYLVEVEDSLKGESMVDEVTSAGTVFRNFDYSTPQSVKAVLSVVPQAGAFFSDDFATTVIYVKADLGGGEEKVVSLEDAIKSKLSKISPPPGVTTGMTGNPPIRVEILRMLVQDAVFTFLVSYAIIFGLVIVLQRSLNNAALMMIPLTLGVAWTVGTLGWMGIPLSIATVGIGAMILGLGVEYGVFMLSRYEEFILQGETTAHAISKAVPAVGLALVGSGGTTIVGFLALTLSIMPMLQHLGISLALGIFYALASTILAMPAIIVLWKELGWHTRANDIAARKRAPAKAARKARD